MKWNVGSKMGLGFGLVLAIFIAVGFASWRALQSQSEDAKWVAHTHDVIATIASLRWNAQQAESAQRGFIITGDDRYSRPYQSALSVIENNRLRLIELVRDNAQQSARAQTLSTMLKERLAVMAETMDIRRRQDFAAAQQAVLSGRGTSVMEDLRELLDEMDRQEEELLKARAASAAATTRSANVTVIGGTMLALLIAGIMGLLITRNVAGPLRKLTAAADRITVGDLGSGIDLGERRDEIGQLAQAFGRMTNSLRAMASAADQIASGDLRASLAPQSPQDVLGHAFVKMTTNLRAQIGGMLEGATVLGSAASEIVASTTQLAAGASESAAAVSQTTTTVEEVRQTAQMATQKARTVSDNAQKVVLIATTGRKNTEESLAGMGRIRAQMEAIGSSMMRLSEQTQAIGQIIASVEDLAAQSNLLAVNAAIEAAKAGEQGKGFGVVAQEVKSLAEQSRQATERVRVILGDIQKATTAAVMATEQGAKAVDSGNRQTESAGETIQALAGSVTEAAQAATQIAASSQQQLVGMDQVAGAMESIKQASTQNVASARQLESAARNLSELGQRLKTLVAGYSV